MGLVKTIMKSGSGALPRKGQQVTVHCTGYGKDRDLSKKFWSTKDPGQEPFTFQVGVGQVNNRILYFHEHYLNSRNLYLYCSLLSFRLSKVGTKVYWVCKLEKSPNFTARLTTRTEMADSQLGVFSQNLNWYLKLRYCHSHNEKLLKNTQEHK